jgi:hypothetical protein
MIIIIEDLGSSNLGLSQLSVLPFIWKDLRKRRQPSRDSNRVPPKHTYRTFGSVQQPVVCVTHSKTVSVRIWQPVHLVYLFLSDSVRLLKSHTLLPDCSLDSGFIGFYLFSWRCVLVASVSSRFARFAHLPVLLT